ncbi:replication initiator protein A [uncultured Agathobaculum sp.]|uniref:replication initiator protein A n=1 Tax=uncultured Agathobaculum sp. TaxID=2048140 RepID=UPI0026175638|nr:replication initiator protein A [uncultured Agathobaculum sp.]
MKQNPEVRPAFTLMKLNDAISHFHMQMPRWLFSDPQYSGLSLESKVAYTFLLNRFQLSRRNGWVNRHGEVYVIYTREDLAREMQVSYRKAIACFKELAQRHLLWEQRQGRGMPNRIFLAEVQLNEKAAYAYVRNRNALYLQQSRCCHCEYCQKSNRNQFISFRISYSFIYNQYVKLFSRYLGSGRATR